MLDYLWLQTNVGHLPGHFDSFQYENSCFIKLSFHNTGFSCYTKYINGDSMRLNKQKRKKTDGK